MASEGIKGIREFLASLPDTLQMSVDEVRALYDQASDYFPLPEGVSVGSEEVLLEDSVGLDRRAKEAGIDSTIEVWEDMIYVWHWFAPMLKEGRDAIERIGEYFKMHAV